MSKENIRVVGVVEYEGGQRIPIIDGDVFDGEEACKCCGHTTHTVIDWCKDQVKKHDVYSVILSNNQRYFSGCQCMTNVNTEELMKASCECIEGYGKFNGIKVTK